MASDDSWKPELYGDKHSFVWTLGAPVVELLNPQPGERVLDIGCGTGQLTAQIAEAGADVIGLDYSPAMIEQARRSYPNLSFQLGDAHDFRVESPFDAVFSNATLHWIREPERVVRQMAKAIKSAGRLAVEFGGRGNVQLLAEAIQTAYHSIAGETLLHPWYFPSIVEFGLLLEENQLEVTQAALIDRPTPLEGADGLKNWVRMFGTHWLNRISEEQQNDFFAELERLANPTLYRGSIWYADYRRLRLAARKI